MEIAITETSKVAVCVFPLLILSAVHEFALFSCPSYHGDVTTGLGWSCEFVISAIVVKNTRSCSGANVGAIGMYGVNCVPTSGLVVYEVDENFDWLIRFLKELYSENCN